MNTNFLKIMVIICSIAIFPFHFVNAKSGCCSDHGGVAGCSSTGFQKCKDGTTSPTCKCDGSTVKKAAKQEKASKIIPSIFAPAAATTKTTKATVTAKTTGCCSGHGGVAGCGKSGYVKCKDGTQSSTCKCAKEKTKAKEKSKKS